MQATDGILLSGPNLEPVPHLDSGRDRVLRKVSQDSMGNHQARFTLIRGGAAFVGRSRKTTYHVGRRPRQSGVWLRIGRLSGLQRLGRNARLNSVLTQLATVFNKAMICHSSSPVNDLGSRLVYGKYLPDRRCIEYWITSRLAVQIRINECLAARTRLRVYS